MYRDFPGGAVVKNPPANAGDTGSSPSPRGSHMPWSNWPHAPQLLSLRSRACKPQLLGLRAQLQLLKPTCLEPVLCNERDYHDGRGHRNEKHAHRNKG